MAAKIQITYDELINSYEWKLVQKILNRRFPWIKGLKINPNNVNQYNLIFVTILYDPFQLAKEKGWKVAWYKSDGLREGNPIRDLFLSTIYKVPHEIVVPIVNEIDEILRSLKTNRAIPDELKLPESRILQSGDFETVPNYEVPQDAEKYLQKYGES